MMKTRRALSELSKGTPEELLEWQKIREKEMKILRC